MRCRLHLISCRAHSVFLKCMRYCGKLLLYVLNESEQTGVCLDERKRTDLKTAAKIPGDERKNIQGSETHLVEKGGIRGTVYQKYM